MPLPREFGAAPQDPSDGNNSNKNEEKDLPKGVVLGPDGKPCRTCTSGAAWKAMLKKTSGASAAAQTSKAAAPADSSSECPADVEQLGRSSWTLLHTMAATYPERPNAEQQRDAVSFVSSLSRLYPCHWCASDFQRWMKEAKNAPRVSSREEFSQWLCEAHNEVNRKLGKPEFDCAKVDERWRTGWKDGRCD
ncbi:uncharacterized protein PV09_03635 [Verruconis gallopava]|uniref:Sulfhydryl oxidase n=1 Tax=Verruconis gallopava TaxID=253628 RepID=A0A0D2AGS4_9PEZI|nr:uncharacterized protein PV09_03635 [Verruconis gallopava]KIW05780.1 hypothetical protein PV09_03635 [Verruconis gallopava]